jgi:hypothetical protein
VTLSVVQTVTASNGRPSTVPVEQAWSNFCAVWETSTNFGVRAGKMEFVTQNDE